LKAEMVQRRSRSNPDVVLRQNPLKSLPWTYRSWANQVAEKKEALFCSGYSQPVWKRRAEFVKPCLMGLMAGKDRYVKKTSETLVYEVCISFEYSQWRWLHLALFQKKLNSKVPWFMALLPMESDPEEQVGGAIWQEISNIFSFPYPYTYKCKGSCHCQPIIKSNQIASTPLISPSSMIFLRYSRMAGLLRQ
jgi:hypothetical protein